MNERESLPFLYWLAEKTAVTVSLWISEKFACFCYEIGSKSFIGVKFFN